MHDNLDDLERLVILGELEQEVITQEWMQGLTPPGMKRPMNAQEYRSGANFAAMSRAVTTAAEQTTGALVQLRDTIINELVLLIAALPDEDAVQKALTDFAAEQPSAVRVAIAAAADDIQTILDHLYSTGADEVVREAVHQGVKPGEALAGGLDAEPEQNAGIAGVAPTAMWSTILAAAVKAAGARQPTAAEVTDLVLGASVAGPYDLARQAVNIVHGEGRAAAADQLVAPSSVYSSELLDGDTCDECEKIDGYEYISLDEAYADYPDAGPYKDCLGGDRCRGSLLFIWDETPPTDPDEQ